MIRYLTRCTALTALLMLANSGVQARDDVAGNFDYYLLSLSWSPQFCAETRRDDEPQCQRAYAFVVHGLWPQYERGFPSRCSNNQRVTETTINRILPIMPSRGLVLHEWQAHGSCSGASPEGYFSTVEQAYRHIEIPQLYRSVGDYRRITAAQIKHDFIAANPKLTTGDMVLQCRGPYLQEVRVCLDRKLEPRACGADVRYRCGDTVVLRPQR